MATLEISGLRKRFGALEILKGIDLSLEKGGFLVLVGPSGCGKSTLLNTIAGLESITSGEIAHRRARRQRSASLASATSRWCSSPMRSIPTCRWPRTSPSAWRCAACPRRSATKAVAAVAKTLQIEHLLKRRPSQLSGGQRQRVAMGRALVREPQHLPVRRAALQSRRQAARRHAHRDQAAASEARGRPSSMSRTIRSRR